MSSQETKNKEKKNLSVIGAESKVKKSKVGPGNEMRRSMEEREQAGPQSPSLLWPASQQPDLKPHTQLLPALQDTASISHPSALGNYTFTVSSLETHNTD